MNRKRLVSISLVAVLLVALPGCLERSTVIKVNRDGSGIVHIRSHNQEVNIVIGGSKAETDDEPELPSEERLLEHAKEMGPGVRFQSIKPSKNRSGWSGYDLIFEFDDINKLVVTDALTELEDEDDDVAESDPDAEKSRSKKEPPKQEFRFAMKGDTLEIFNLAYDNPNKKEPSPAQPQEGAIDPFAEEPAASPATFNIQEAAITQVYAKLLSEVRVGVFVQIDGPIESSNALHRKESLITLVNANVGKMLEDPAAVSKMKAIEHLENDPHRRAKIQELANETDGLDVDAQEKIVVKLGQSVPDSDSTN